MNEHSLKHRTDSFVEGLFRTKLLLYCCEISIAPHRYGYFLLVRRTKPCVTILKVTCNAINQFIQNSKKIVHKPTVSWIYSVEEHPHFGKFKCSNMVKTMSQLTWIRSVRIFHCACETQVIVTFGPGNEEEALVSNNFLLAVNYMQQKRKKIFNFLDLLLSTMTKH